MKTCEAEVKSARLNKKNEAGDWIAPDGTNLGPKGKSTRVVVGKCSYVQFENMDEAVRKLSEVEALKLINTQLETNAKNEARASAVGVPSEKALQAEVFQRILQNPEKLKQLQAVSADPASMTAFLASEVAALKAEKGISTTSDDDNDA